MSWPLAVCLALLAVWAVWAIGYAIGYHDGRQTSTLDQATIEQLARTLDTTHTEQR